MYILKFFFVIFYSCADTAVDLPSDTSLYLSASVAQTEKALSLCSQIQDVELKGECVWFAAKTQTERNNRAPQPERVRQAFELCKQAPTSGWMEVCRFDVIDVTGITGEIADQACALTGEFQERCMIHALLREEESLARRYPKGKELAMMEGILLRMTNIGLGELSDEPIHETLTARVVARRFEAGWRSSPRLRFSVDQCGELPQDVCIDAYRIAIKQIGRGRLPKSCRLPMKVEQVLEVGLPGWVSNMDEILQPAWKSLCHATYGPQKAPDYASSQKAKKESQFKSSPTKPKNSSNKSLQRK